MWQSWQFSDFVESLLWVLADSIINSEWWMFWSKAVMAWQHAVLFVDPYCLTDKTGFLTLYVQLMLNHVVCQSHQTISVIDLYTMKASSLLQRHHWWSNKVACLLCFASNSSAASNKDLVPVVQASQSICEAITFSAMDAGLCICATLWWWSTYGGSVQQRSDCSLSRCFCAWI